MSSRPRGAHRRVADRSPRVYRGVVVFGVLSTVLLLCGVAASLLDDGVPGSSSQAAALRTGGAEPTGMPRESATGGSGAPTGSPSGSGSGSAVPAGSTGPSSAAAVVASPSAAVPRPSPSAQPQPRQAPVSAADRLAGLVAAGRLESGSGRFQVAPGVRRAPGPGPVYRVRIEVEQGIGVDPGRFASFVLDTLNDDRSWSHHGSLSFARTDGQGDLRVVLAGPASYRRLCGSGLPGLDACGGPGTTVWSAQRWLHGIPVYANLTAYRRYLVNHELGHLLGHPYAFCTPGRPAPVMMRQIKGLQGCLPNAWPFP